MEKECKGEKRGKGKLKHVKKGTKQRDVFQCIWTGSCSSWRTFCWSAIAFVIIKNAIRNCKLENGRARVWCVETWSEGRREKKEGWGPKRVPVVYGQFIDFYARKLTTSRDFSVAGTHVQHRHNKSYQSYENSLISHTDPTSFIHIAKNISTENHWIL